MAGRGRRRGADGGAGAGTAAVSGDDDLPDPTAQALEALDPQGSNERGAQAFAIGAAPAPDELKTTRVSGGDPAALRRRSRLCATSCSTARPDLVLAPGDEPGFATPAAAWAARSGDPVLFSGAEKLPAATLWR